MPTHGGMYQSGFPDLYCTHEKYGQRWIEVKLPDMQGSKFTPAQKKHFPELVENGTPIWIFTAASETQYKLLFERPEGNFLDYWLIYHW